jgi:hypothetical protein
MGRVGCGEDMADENAALVLVCVFGLLAVDGLYEAAWLDGSAGCDLGAVAMLLPALLDSGCILCQKPLDEMFGYLLRGGIALVEAGRGGRSQLFESSGLTGLVTSSRRM